MTYRDVYRKASQFLREKAIPDPDFSARYLLAHVTASELNTLPLLWDKTLSSSQEHLFFHLVNKRGRGIPLAYLVGYTDFYGKRFAVRPGVLIPRPDTEHILYAVQEFQQDFSHILDIGTGTGILAISLGFLFPHAIIEACDISWKAIRLAKFNARKLKKNIRFHWCDFLKRPPSGKYDLIVSNPPYISPQESSLIEPSVLHHEPEHALFGGEDGLLFYRAIAHYSLDHLSLDGKIVVEVDHKWEKIRAIFTEHHLNCHIRYDYQNLPRVLIAERKA